MAIYVVAGICIFSNVVWLIMFLKRERTLLEMSKLIASRTLSEYAWLGKAEKPHQTAKEPGYESIWEEEDVKDR